jgi:hypothetical protein
VLGALGLALATAVSAGAQPAATPPRPPDIGAAAVLAQVKVLASDEYEGRAPGTRGEELSVT